MELFAHRGASAYAPENTLPAFRKALELGARGIELDVQLTSDGVPVVFHDFFLDKKTNSSGLVRKLSWKEISALDAGSWFSNEYKGTRIPTLEEVLEIVPRDVCLNIEIKALSLFKEPIARKVCDIMAADAERDYMISSFNHQSLKEVQELDNNVRIGILTSSHMLNVVDYVESSGLKPYSLNPEASYLTNEYVADAHRKGWKVLSYVVNSPEMAEIVAQTGIDGIFSDYPDLEIPASV
ncbi:MAG: hypothetical protein B6241_12315 [Spirochaetaceae bacterium 4572_59]|nr:MAG: hypothetical protein B6241_12315 [Spirochaetaceae bacterium 4572_59]